MAQGAGLFTTHGTPVALKSVGIEGQIDGVLATTTITQHYRNDSGNKLEIVYTFPLAWGAVLLGMDVSLGGRRLHGVITEKEQAWAHYEKSVDEGTAAILVEQSAPDLYTANLGCIESGEDVMVELRYAQLLHFDQDSLRLTIPSAIAPRFGDQHRDGGLSPHETADADLLIEYPLTLSLLLRENLTGARVECPSHSYSMERTENGSLVTLNPGARLDRDVILIIHGVEQRSFALAGPDIEGRALVLAGFRPAFSQPEMKPLRLKILADCSGSMAGNSIRSLKEGLRCLTGMLQTGDCISYSRFGSRVCHETSGFLAWSSDSGEAGKKLADALDRTEADLGGTNMEQALLSTFADIRLPHGEHEAAYVLLITDGAVWAVDAIIRSARTSGQRIFAIGVGSAPAESLLRKLALETGGACAFVSPHENIAWTVRRMLDRMRGPSAGSLLVDWGAKSAWQTALPLNVYDGDCIYAFASFTEPTPDVRLSGPVLRWQAGGKKYELPAEASGMVWNDAITRVAGAARLEVADTPEESRGLALRYQLMSKHTAMFLVHEREGGKKPGVAMLHQVPQMMAAGHGGFSSVLRPLEGDGLGAGPRNICLDAAEAASFLSSMKLRFYYTKPLLSPLALLRKFESMASKKEKDLSTLERIVDILKNDGPDRELAAISAKVDLSMVPTCVLFLDWLRKRLTDSCTLSDEALDWLRQLLIWLIPKSRKSNAEAANMLFELAFAGISSDSWKNWT